MSRRANNIDISFEERVWYSSPEALQVDIYAQEVSAISLGRLFYDSDFYAFQTDMPSRSTWFRASNRQPDGGFWITTTWANLVS
jgi:hypothetical protein